MSECFSDEFNDLLIMDKKDDILERQGFHTVNVWNGDHKFHQNKVNIFNCFGMRQRLYGFTKDDVIRYKKFLIFETGKAWWIVDDILKWNPTAKIKFVMVNIVADYGAWKIEEIKKRGVEIFSFDGEDCKKYALSKYTTFYKEEISVSKKETLSDIYFIGKDKGRIEFLLKIQNAVQKHMVKTDFNVVLERGSKYRPGDLQGIHLRKASMSYTSVIDGVVSSTSVLDIVQKGQCGMTMRPLESVLYGKKLITNNKNVQELPFYRYGNVLIIDELNLDEIYPFLRRAFVPYPDEEKERYSYKNFLKVVFGIGNI